MIIDAHVNITHNGKWFNTDYNASLERLFDEMNEAHIDKCLLISMPFATSNRYIASVIEKHPEKFRGFGSLDFSKELLKQVNEISAMGLSGIKIHPRVQHVNICDGQLDFLWKYFDQKGTNVLVDGYYQVSETSVRIQDLVPLTYEDYIKHYSNVTFILAHAGCHKVMDTFFLCRSHTNFYCDISYSINIFKETSFYQDYRFLISNADKKVLFGSDFPEVNILSAIQSYKVLGRDCSEVKYANVLGLNAYKLFWEKNQV